MYAYLLVALGSALGGAGRYWCSMFVAQRIGESFPWGTLLVNVSGSFLIGLLGALGDPQAAWHVTPGARQFLMIGVLGGFTTFSSFSLQTLALMREGEWTYAAANVFASVVACLIAVWLGFVLAASLSRSA
jgi:CrcB protein